MLKEIKIKNYKAYKQEATLEIRPLTILIGRNSSGKSSLCKLIDAISEAMQDDATGFLPLQTEHNRLGDMYGDLFYRQITNDMLLEMVFDVDKRINVNFLMQDGVFCPKSYTAQEGELVETKNFSNKEESLQAGFAGLYYRDICEAAGISHGDVKFSVDYIGPIRCRAKRRIDMVNVKRGNYVGENGEKAYEMLLQSLMADGELLKRVSAWCKTNMEGQELCILEQAPVSGDVSLYG